MTEDEKQLVDLEKKLGLVPRRELKQQLELVKRDITQTRQLFQSRQWDYGTDDKRQEDHMIIKHLSGILKKNWNES